jgi:predicted amidohydrolase
MKIGVAQFRPVKGNIPANITSHKKLIELAISSKADAIFFPELSITGYEPELAKDLATNQDDRRFDDFQQISDINQITLGFGAPTQSDAGILISMIIFQPHKPRQTYSKQQLHSDEFPYFVSGDNQIILTVDNIKIAPAICYESLQADHAENANQRGAEIYLASVAKSQAGVDKAQRHFPDIASKYAMPVLMANCVGYCDKFESASKSAIWNKAGDLVGQLNDAEGILIFDSETEAVIEKTL